MEECRGAQTPSDGSDSIAGPQVWWVPMLSVVPLVSAFHRYSLKNEQEIYQSMRLQVVGHQCRG